MALTVLNSPPSMALARNPVALKLQTNNFITVAGEAGNTLIVVAHKVKIGETIEITWNGNDITFTGAASPDKSGRQVTGISSTVSPDSAYYSALAEELNTNYLLAEDFLIGTGPGGTSVALTARQAGAQYEPSITSTVASVSGGSTYGSETDNINFSILFELWIEQTYGGGDYAKALQLERAPDVNQNAIFRFENILLAALDKDLPAFDGDPITIAANMIRNYYYRYAEKYGDTPAVQYLENPAESAKLALMAGMSYINFPGNTFIADCTTATSGRKFLTTQPRTKSISPDGQEWLYYYNDLTTGSLAAMAIIYYSDGTNETKTLNSPLTISAAGVYLFAAGYVQGGVQAASNGAKTVTAYDYWVQHSGGHTSEIFSFKLDTRTYTVSQWYLFQNSLGGFDTVWMTGNVAKGLDITRTTAERTPEFDYAESDQQFFTPQVFYRNHYEVNTGYKKKAYTDYLQELIISQYVYQIINGFGFVPVTIDETSVELYKLKDTVFGLVFKAKDGFNNTNY